MRRGCSLPCRNDATRRDTISLRRRLQFALLWYVSILSRFFYTHRFALANFDLDALDVDNEQVGGEALDEQNGGELSTISTAAKRANPRSTKRTISTRSRKTKSPQLSALELDKKGKQI